MADNIITDDVVAAARMGDRDALTDVYARLAPSVLRYLRTRGVVDPEAVTNDVFVALLRQLPRLDDGATGLRTLTFSIAHARMVDDQRARTRHPTATYYDAEDDQRVVESAEDDALLHLGTARVVELLALLPRDQREVLTLRVLSDLSLDQVAHIMGRSAGAVKQLQRRALLGVRQVLAEQ